jgi:hypothetical protein
MVGSVRWPWRHATRGHRQLPSKPGGSGDTTADGIGRQLLVDGSASR